MRGNDVIEIMRSLRNAQLTYIESKTAGNKILKTELETEVDQILESHEQGKIEFEEEGDKIINAIEVILIWYFKDSTLATIQQLLKAQDKLSVLSVTLAETAAGAKELYNAKYFIRRISVAKSKQVLIGKGSKISEADNKALIENEWEYKIEQSSEAAAYRVDILLRNVKNVLAAMQQRISYLKIEFEKANIAT